MAAGACRMLRAWQRALTEGRALRRPARAGQGPDSGGARIVGMGQRARVYLDDAQGAVVLRVRPHSRFGRRRCGVCRRPCPGFDPGGGLRRWRTLDLGERMCLLEGEAPRVCCPQHGVVVAAVP